MAFQSNAFQNNAYQVEDQEQAVVVEQRGGTSRRDKKLKRKVKHHWENAYEPLTPVVPEVIDVPVEAAPSPVAYEGLAEKIEKQARDALAERKIRRKRMIRALMAVLATEDDD